MILFLSAYPPRECGIASYTYQLVASLQEQLDGPGLAAAVCALEPGLPEDRQEEIQPYPAEVRYQLNTADPEACRQMALKINNDQQIAAVCIQHRYGLWGGERWGENLLHFVAALEKPLSVVLHKVLPEPEPSLLHLVATLQQHAVVLITHTMYHANILLEQYGVPEAQLRIIPHGAPVVKPFNKESLKKAYKLEGKLVLSTFGYLRRSKGIEQVLEALDAIRKIYPEVVYLILGKTHPTAARFEGERYRIQLKDYIFRKGLQKNIRFVNRHLQQEELQAYMCLSDVYLHASKTNLSSLLLAQQCGVPVISTQAPATEEFVQTGGIFVDFTSAASLAAAVTETLQEQLLAPQHKQPASSLSDQPAAWPNVARAYRQVFQEIMPVQMLLPALKPDHLYHLTTAVGLQRLDQQRHPTAEQQAYLLQENARALIVALEWNEAEPSQELLMLMLMRRFLNVIRKSQQPDGVFLSQLDDQGDRIPEKAGKQQLEECSMQAMWALARLIKGYENLPADLSVLAQRLFVKAMAQFSQLTSLRAAAYAIKALYHYQAVHPGEAVLSMLEKQAAMLQEAFASSATESWPWFEKELAQENSLLPDAMLLASHATGNEAYRTIALQSFGFLIEQYFSKAKPQSGEQYIFNEKPREVSNTIRALSLFYQQTGESVYLEKMVAAFGWFMGNNTFREALYDPASGSCYDGFNSDVRFRQQDAESLVSYLLARITMEKYFGMPSPEQKQSVPIPVRRLEQKVPLQRDRPSMPSGKVKVLAN